MPATHRGDMKFIAWDIETDTSGGFGLDPNNGGIVSIAAGIYEIGEDERVEDMALTRSFYETIGTAGHEASLIAAFDQWMHLYAPMAPLVGWNSTCFDAPFVDRRAAILGVSPHLDLRHDPSITPKYESTPGYDGGYQHRWCETESFDLAFEAFTKQWCETNDVSFSLKPVADHFGLHPVVVDREKIHLLSPDDLRDYNLSDVRVTAELYARHWIRAESLSKAEDELTVMFGQMSAMVDDYEDRAHGADPLHALAVREATSHVRKAMACLTLRIRQMQADTQDWPDRS